ncbi:MAG: outer membrane protein assembly factor BamD [Planctomycetota bacterium]|nr:outer membrane protein assembly factor BamD [Planctomycetota bacterium]
MHATRAVSILALLLAAGCAGVEGPELPDWLDGGGSNSSRRVVIPNQVAGGAPGAEPLPGSSDALARAQGRTPEEQAQRTAEAQALWQRANQTTNPGAAADLYQELASDFPESPNAAEAMFRVGAARYRQGEWNAAIESLVTYMSSIPVNPYLAEVEEMLYTSAIRMLNTSGGLQKLFVSNERPLNTLDFVAATFPAGNYADDALLRIAQYHQQDEAWALAVLHYKELLIRYPDSEWSFRARLGLADSYLQRDQGDPYHAGFVDLDPRESYETEQAQTFGADVKSSLRMALEQYEAFLERIELDPARQAEYAQEVAYARRMRGQVRNALAAKDLRIARWYRGQGDTQAARTYLQYAAAYGDTANGRAAAAELAALGGGRMPGTRAPTVRPPTAPPTRVVPPTRAVPTRTAPPPPQATPVRPPASSRSVPPPPPPPAWPPEGRR